MTSAAPAGKPGFSDLEANILQFLSALARQVLISRILGMWGFSEGTVWFATRLLEVNR